MGERQPKNRDGEPRIVNIIEGVVLGDVVQAGHIDGDVHMNRTGVGPVPVVAPVLPPEQAAPEVFVGRAAQVERLHAQWRPEAGRPANVVVVTGMGGIGKTALVRNASALAVRHGWFSGGAVTVDMHGYEPAGDRIEESAVFAPLLRALGTDPEQIPDAPAEQATGYHQLLGLLARQQRRVLLVLDNVSSVDQVRGLLPRNAEHHVVITGRDTLPLPGALALELDVLPAAEARDLLRSTLEDSRVSDPAAERIVALCGGLPLAVTIAAAVLAEDPALTAAALAAELEDAETRLTTLEQGAAAVGAAFDVSWRRLTNRDPPTARLLKLLTLNPGSDISTEAAAALLGQPLEATRPRLRNLRRTHLLQLSDGHWQLHDLIRLFVRDRRAPQHGDEVEDPAVPMNRLLEHYLRVAQNHAPGTDPGWFGREYPNLLAAVPLATALGRPDITVDLVYALAELPELRRHASGNAFLAFIRQAVAAVEELDDPPRHAKTLRWLAFQLHLRGRSPEAVEVARKACAVARSTQDHQVQVDALLTLGKALLQDQQHEAAACAYQQALDLSRAATDAKAEFLVVGYLSDVLSSRLRRHRESISVVRQAVVKARELGDREEEGILLTHLGATLATAGDAAQAFATLGSAAALCHATGNREHEARAQANLALLYAQIGKHGEMNAAHRRAAEIWREDGEHTRETELLVNIGVVLTQMSGLDEGTAALQRAVEMCRSAGDENAEGEALFRLGSFLADRLQFSAACTAHQQAVEIWRDIGNRHREGVELQALAEALLAAGRRAAALRSAAEAIEALQDSGDPVRAAKVQEWSERVPVPPSDAPEPDGPTSTVVTKLRGPGFGGLYTPLSIAVIALHHYFGWPWWVLVCWAVCIPLLQDKLKIHFTYEINVNEARFTEEAARVVEAINRGVKGLVFVVVGTAAAVAFHSGELWWALALCTFLAVLRLRGLPRLLVYLAIGATTAHYLWGTWWALLAFAVLVLGVVVPREDRTERKPVEIG
ncbi:AAA ATPase domain-containing protein [Saccharopolyspora kobensis]|uniref:AAA ATPase domain-containing protein n=1 Tax=Saccharopolyspora kobensis TaxID=146035 RepID=A0A1H5ZQV1_9PSEU|nr:tetratricopeptide repeat protein [Saccharopolyspora kobensis]SEG38933.1 AAA ATPase domain-containing protein [Saccharopolyspora kobensis]SFE12794.1 AAA ATPase domain-containing protein [Saccharopolyspora kobensis]